MQAQAAQGRQAGRQAGRHRRQAFGHQAQAAAAAPTALVGVAAAVAVAAGVGVVGGRQLSATLLGRAQLQSSGCSAAAACAGLRLHADVRLLRVLLALGVQLQLECAV